jgi:hypothetical protein
VDDARGHAVVVEGSQEQKSPAVDHEVLDTARRRVAGVEHLGFIDDELALRFAVQPPAAQGAERLEVVE